jgi:ribosomal protein S18 acetylase RimI-like enzyme
LRASPVFFGPGTLVRTWGTRPVPMGSCCDLGSLKDGFTNRMGRPVCRIEAVSTANLSELLRLYIAYRVFYGEAAEEERAIAFIRERVTQSAGRYFLAWDETSRAIGFMHLMPSTNTLAMRPIWLLEDLYVDVAARGQGVATALLSYAEEFARSSGAERLTLATAHDNLAAQHIYKKLGYVREEHFLYFHRLLP